MVFKKTMSFSPFATDIPPVCKDECLPDPPSFANRFAWNGQGQPGQAEAAHDRRQLEQWGSSKLGRWPGAVIRL